MCLTSLFVFSQNRCGTCNGTGSLICGYCRGYGSVTTTIWDAYWGCYRNVVVACPTCQGYKRVLCSNCGGKGTVTSPVFGGKSSWFVKTKYGCSICTSGNNGCKGYWGIYHTDGTYEGNCQNSDGWGHKCGHSPEKHGLRSRK